MLPLKEKKGRALLITHASERMLSLLFLSFEADRVEEEIMSLSYQQGLASTEPKGSASPGEQSGSSLCRAGRRAQRWSRS